MDSQSTVTRKEYTFCIQSTILLLFFYVVAIYFLFLKTSLGMAVLEIHTYCIVCKDSEAMCVCFMAAAINGR